MKVQIAADGLRIRLKSDEYKLLAHEPILLDCNGWVLRLQYDPAGLSSLLGWPFHPVITVGFRDMADWLQEPENGIVLTTMTPRCELDVDYRHDKVKR